MSKFFSEAFFAHDGKVSDKWQQYLSIYDRELNRFFLREEPTHVLEIGVQNGGSLEIWSKILPKGSTITGIDIDPKCAALSFDKSSIRVLTVDAADPKALNDALGDMTFDIVLDDGSHQSSHIISTFIACFPRVLHGGLYIIEDLHASYWKEFGGGFRTPDSAIEWLKCLVDAEHTDYLRDAISSEDNEFLRDMNQYIQRISFYDSVCIVEKHLQTKQQPYKRILSGRQAAVMEPSFLSELDGPGLGSNLMLTANALDGAIINLRGERDAALVNLRNEIERATRAETHLKKVIESTSWRLTKPLRLVANYLYEANKKKRLTLNAAFLNRIREAINIFPRRLVRYNRPTTNSSHGKTKSETAYKKMKQQFIDSNNENCITEKHYPITLFAFSEVDLVHFCSNARFPSCKEPLVSIIIPVYNNVLMTAECLASILKFTDTEIPYEVIISDDNSTNETGDLLSSIKGIVYRRNTQNLHFVRNCNAAARDASGSFLLFLNNDTQVTSGWLKPLVDSFNAFPSIGAVGPKILYPTGLLQEAGVKVMPNASSTMIGLNDNPTKAQYNFSREVDYCSGAALLIKKDVFLEVGGFSDELSPAYCEDLDLSLKLRSIGLKTWYASESLVIHHLSKTTAANGSDSKLDMIKRNQQKIAEKWPDAIHDLNKVRMYAFYLPQFHTFPENDRWWGKGFTEWSNVTRAKPMYKGHVQPQLPSDLGFYDLRLPDILCEQAILAQKYGIEGFCFYYYWFAGKRLLETPLEMMLASGKPDFPFMLCWANENWSRRWDGQEQEVLMSQSHSPEDDIAVIQDLMRFMRDKRYARVDGKPVILVYKVGLFPDFSKTSNRWRDSCRRSGIGDIFIVAADTINAGSKAMNPTDYGCDASVQFPPHRHPNKEINRSARSVSRDFKGQIFDYEQTALSFGNADLPSAPSFPGVMPAWDNTPRRMNSSMIFDGASEGAFQAWVEQAIQRTLKFNAPDQRFVFINAWNEWAEGAQIEPGKTYGHSRLQAIKNALVNSTLCKD